MGSILPLSKTIAASRFGLAALSFDIVNWNNITNATLSADTPKGVLGGMVATVSSGQNWEAAVATGVTHASVPAGRSNRITALSHVLGLFLGNSEGNAFENAPAAASGVVPIYMGGGLFEVYVFETTASADESTSLLSGYTMGAPLYCSPWGFLTPEKPTDADANADFTATGSADVVIASVTCIPTASSLLLGIKLLV